MSVGHAAVNAGSQYDKRGEILPKTFDWCGNHDFDMIARGSFPLHGYITIRCRRVQLDALSDSRLREMPNQRSSHIRTDRQSTTRPRRQKSIDIKTKLHVTQGKIRA